MGRCTLARTDMVGLRRSSVSPNEGRQSQSLEFIDDIMMSIPPISRDRNISHGTSENHSALLKGNKNTAPINAVMLTS